MLPTILRKGLSKVFNTSLDTFDFKTFQAMTFNQTGGGWGLSLLKKI